MGNQFDLKQLAYSAGDWTTRVVRRAEYSEVRALYALARMMNFEQKDFYLDSILSYEAKTKYLVTLKERFPNSPRKIEQFEAWLFDGEHKGIEVLTKQHHLLGSFQDVMQTHDKFTLGIKLNQLAGVAIMGHYFRAGDSWTTALSAMFILSTEFMPFVNRERLAVGSYTRLVEVDANKQPQQNR